MKTTVVIPDALMGRLKQEAARGKTTMSELIERALRQLLEAEAQQQAPALTPLPSFNMGRPAVDVANRDALYDAMEG
jgi:predicted transcriptional regulator